MPKPSIPADVPLVTYVTRCFEPYRGWPQVAEGLALLMQRNPRAHVLLVGSDEVAYGAKRDDGLSWREWALKQWPMDPKQTASAASAGLRRLQTCNSTQLGTRLLDSTLHLELELDGSNGKWLLHRCQ